MTTSEPDPAAQSTPSTGERDVVDDAPSTSQRQSRWNELTRFNKIAALVLVGVTSLFVAVLIFGAGVMVGAEWGDSEGHHRHSETSDYGVDEHGGSGGDEGADSGDGGDRGADNGSEDNRHDGEFEGPDQPAAPAPPTPAVPRP